MSAPRDPVPGFGPPTLGEQTQNVNIVASGFPYTLSDGDFVVACNKANPAAAVTVKLPASPGDGRIVCVKDYKGDAATNNVTVDGNGKNIEGAATDLISVNKAERWYRYDVTAAEWKRMFTGAGGGGVPAAHGSTHSAGGSDPLATDAVGGVALAASAIRTIAVTGKNGAGACTATGAKVGDKVIAMMNVTDQTVDNSKFESTITVADQIQQSNAGDLSAKKYFLQLVAKS